MMTNGDTIAGLRFMRLGMLALAIGMFFGVIGGFQFLFPDFLRELLFTKTRPLHVSLASADQCGSGFPGRGMHLAVS